MNNFYNETHKTNKVLNPILKNQIKIELKEFDTIAKRKPGCLTSSIHSGFLRSSSCPSYFNAYKLKSTKNKEIWLVTKINTSTQSKNKLNCYFNVYKLK